MLIGHFTEQPWQDPNSGLMGTQQTDMGISNGLYDPEVGAQLYNRYIDEKVYAEEMGFDAVMLNEHHSTPFCMQGVTNVGASILARVTKKVKIIILGNILPIWDDPLWLGRAARYDRHDLPRASRLGLRSRRPGKYLPQRSSPLQLGAVRGGPRLPDQDLDHARALPLGGQALPVPVRQPLARP